MERLVNTLQTIPEYSTKLNFLLSVKGFSFYLDLRAYPNYDITLIDPYYNEAIPPPFAFDLNPHTPEHKQTFNHKFECHLLNEWKTKSEFDKGYQGINFIKETDKYKQAIPKADDPRHLVASLMKEIEKAMNYKQPEKTEDRKDKPLTPHEKYYNHVVKQIAETFGPYYRVNDHFNVLAYEFTVDYSEKKFDKDDVLKITMPGKYLRFTSG